MEPQDKTCTAKTGFECNICFDIPIEPVVSMCGHLYCWSCMYRVSVFDSLAEYINSK